MTGTSLTGAQYPALKQTTIGISLGFPILKRNYMLNTIKDIVSLASAIVLLQSCSQKDLVDLTPEFSLDALSNPSGI